MSSQIKHIISDMIEQKLNESKIDPKLQSVADKHGVKLKNNKVAHEFNYNDEASKDFHDAGYKLSYNAKKNHFDIYTLEVAAKKAADRPPPRRHQVAQGRAKMFPGRR
jgi:nitric oxide synthase oxygenase domain/subunit